MSLLSRSNQRRRWRSQNGFLSSSTSFVPHGSRLRRTRFHERCWDGRRRRRRWDGWESCGRECEEKGESRLRRSSVLHLASRGSLRPLGVLSFLRSRLASSITLVLDFTRKMLYHLSEIMLKEGSRGEKKEEELSRLTSEGKDGF